MVCTFLTDDKIYENISNMGNNYISYSIAIGMENIYFLNRFFRFINKEKINDDDLLESYDYLVSKCGEGSFKKLGTYKILPNYDNLFQRN